MKWIGDSLWRLGLLTLVCSTGCVSTIENSVTQSVSPGHRLMRASYHIDTSLKRFPGRSPGKTVGGNFSWAGFTLPRVAEQRTGIYLTEPYDPNRKVVLFIHGLLSSPYSWKDLSESLSADPVIMEHYQFWYYAYPSSTPLIASSAIFRRHLDQLVNDLSSVHGAMDREIILIGHSMGGILAKSIVSSTGDRLWNQSFKVPAAELDLPSAEHRSFIQNAFVFEPRRFVRKAVFIASPHRGSQLAEGAAGQIGISLARTPRLIEEFVEELRGPKNRHLIQPRFLEFLDSDVNSIATLQPGGPVADQLARLPIDNRVTFHSIAGTKEGDSDGVVPISSTYIQGALCEATVHSGHSVHRHPATAEWIKMILKFDAQLIDQTQIQAIVETLPITSESHIW